MAAEEGDPRIPAPCIASVEAGFDATIHTNDSANPDPPAGWGCTLVECDAAGDLSALTVDFFGPVVESPQSSHYIGATVLTINTAELSAVYYALAWICVHGSNKRVGIFYDSEYAAGATRVLFRPVTNLELMIQWRRIYTLALSVARSITWVHVDAHSGIMLNERVDLLARCGAFFGYTVPPHLVCSLRC